MSTRFGLASLALAVLLAGCSSIGTNTAPTVAPAGIPPVGVIWFGASFDTTTFAIRNRVQSVGATEAFSFVGHTRRWVDASELVISQYWNGKLISTNRPNATGSGDVWGFTPGPLFEKGKWRYDLTDIGGNVLASGTVTAT